MLPVLKQDLSLLHSVHVGHHTTLVTPAPGYLLPFPSFREHLYTQAYGHTDTLQHHGIFLKCVILEGYHALLIT